jgi:hypothetical protein
MFQSCTGVTSDAAVASLARNSARPGTLPIGSCCANDGVRRFPSTSSTRVSPSPASARARPTATRVAPSPWRVAVTAIVRTSEYAGANSRLARNRLKSSSSWPPLRAARVSTE